MIWHAEIKEEYLDFSTHVIEQWSQVFKASPLISKWSVLAKCMCLKLCTKDIHVALNYAYHKLYAKIEIRKDQK
jgi:hypothetical protein